MQKLSETITQGGKIGLVLPFAYFMNFVFFVFFAFFNFNSHFELQSIW